MELIRGRRKIFLEIFVICNYDMTYVGGHFVLRELSKRWDFQKIGTV